MNSLEMGKLIIAEADRFVNLYEIKANADWRFITDPSKGKPQSDELDAAMKSCGWNDGLPYCAAFCEAMWKLAYTRAKAPTSIITEFSKKLTPSVMLSYTNFKPRITKEPIPGSIFFMQNGKGATGHAGIVIANDGTNMATIEGNTSAGKAISVEADRNGDGIFRKVRKFDLKTKTGLHLIGFLNPIGW